jgi:hypothetical protein
MLVKPLGFSYHSGKNCPVMVFFFGGFAPETNFLSRKTKPLNQQKIRI